MKTSSLPILLNLEGRKTDVETGMKPRSRRVHEHKVEGTDFFFFRIFLLLESYGEEKNSCFDESNVNQIMRI